MAPKEKTRELLLRAGRQRVIAEGLPEGIDVKLTDVLGDVGLSTGAAYNIWASQKAYRQDLSLHIAESFEWADATAVLTAIEALPEDSTMDDWVRTVSDTYFPLFVANMDFFVVLHFWAVKDPRPELVEALKRGYDEVHESFKAIYQEAVEHYGLQLIEPYTPDDATIMITAAIEGFAVRHRFESQRLTTDGRHLFAETMSLLARSILTKK